MKRKNLDPDFELFKSECSRWIDFFGLKNWWVVHQRKNLGDSYADITARVDCAIANINFDTKGDSCLDIPRTAFHEICHMLLGGLVSLARERYVVEREIDAEEESIIRILENSVFETLNKVHDP
jgi:hypothetical protein